jgi:hypothetical protein
MQSKANLFKNLNFKNMRNFKVIEGDIDYRVSEKSFTGKLTKGRYLTIDKYCRVNTFRAGNCGHEWDCCGCLSRSKMEFTYKHNQVIITLTESFNY